MFVCVWIISGKDSQYLCMSIQIPIPSVALEHSELQQTPNTSRHERSMVRNATKRSTEEALATEEENVTEDLELTESRSVECGRSHCNIGQGSR